MDDVDLKVREAATALLTVRDALGRRPAFWRKNARAAFDSAKWEKLAATAEARVLERYGAGAVPGEWGVFTVRWVSVEQTLRTIAAHRRTHEWLKGPALQSIGRAAEARAESVLGNSRSLTTFEKHMRVFHAAAIDLRVSAMIAMWDLRFLLPERLRPIPEGLERYERNDGRLKLEVSSGPECVLLHSIVVRPSSRGVGFGTVVLEDLCRYADSRGLSIVCDVVPGETDPADKEEAFRRLARWYARHGFASTEGTVPDAWEVGERVVRPPRA